MELFPFRQMWGLLGSCSAEVAMLELHSNMRRGVGGRQLQAFSEAALVHVVAWCWTGTKPLHEPMMIMCPSTYNCGVIAHQFYKMPTSLMWNLIFLKFCILKIIYKNSATSTRNLSALIYPSPGGLSELNFYVLNSFEETYISIYFCWCSSPLNLQDSALTYTS